MLSGSSDFPIQVQDFYFDLPTDTIFIDKTAKSNCIQGSLVLSLKSPLTKVSAVEIRFVGVVEAKAKNKRHSLVGHERLFDRTFKLSSQTDLNEKQHEFPFVLALPSGSPTSISSDRLRVQYMIVAVISFENGCFGLIPYLAKDPIRIHQEISVSNIDLHPSFSLRAEQQEDKSRMSMQTVPGDQKPTLLWSPNQMVLLQISPLQFLNTTWEIRVQIDSKIKLDSIEYNLEEYAEYKYSVDRLSKEPVNFEASERLVLASGVVDSFKSYVEFGDEVHLLVKFPMRDLKAGAMPDIHSIPAIVTHSLRLKLVLVTPTAAPTESTIEQVLPIQLHKLDILHDNSSLETLTNQSQIRKRR